MIDYSPSTYYTFCRILVNNEDIDSDFYHYISNVQVELNAYNVDVCRIDMDLSQGGFDVLRGKMLAKEGDYIQVNIGKDSDIYRGTSNVFAGIVKTIMIDASDTVNVSIEAFDELFLLDFDNTAIEVEVPEDAMTNEFTDVIEKYSDEIKDVLITGNIEPDAQPKKSKLYQYLQSIQKKYPNIIENIYINEPDIPFNSKIIKTTDETPYQSLAKLAKLYDRCLILRKKSLYFVKRNQEILKAFVYNPTVSNYSVPSENEFIVKSWYCQTSLKDQREKVELAYSRRIGSGTVVGKTKVVIKQEPKKQISAEYRQILEDTKKSLESQIASLKEGSVSRKNLQNYYNKWMNETYNKIVISGESTPAQEFKYKYVNKKVYPYDIVLQLGTGECIRVETSAQFASEQDAFKYAEALYYSKLNDFLEIEIELAEGNNLLRPWQFITVIFQDSAGKCEGYNLRYSGVYKISQVSIQLGTNGYRTSIRAHREYVIQDDDKKDDKCVGKFDKTKPIGAGEESLYTRQQIQDRINYLMLNLGIKWNDELERLARYRNERWGK